MSRTVNEIRHTPRGPRPIPLLGPASTVSLPLSTDTVLANGLRVMLVRHPAVPLVHLRLLIPFAAAYPGHPARAHLLRTTLFAGTRRATAEDIADEIARAGGTINAAVTPAHLTIAGTALTDALPTFLDVLVDVLTEATYPDFDVAGERYLLAHRVTAARADPRTHAREAWHRHRYGDHPVACERPGAIDVACVEPAEIRALHDRAVVPDGAVLIVVGALDLDRALVDIDRATAGWTSRHSAQHLPPIPELTGGGDIEVVDLPGADQSHLLVSAQAVAHTDPRYPALRLASLALGGEVTGRLVDRRLAQDSSWRTAHTTLEFVRDHTAVHATVNISVTTATATTAPALHAVRGELDRFVTAPPDGVEVEQSRRYALGADLVNTRSPARLTHTLAQLAGCGLDIGWLATEREQLEAVTADEVAAAARTFFDPTRFTGVIVGDARALAATLSEMDGVRMP